MNKLKSTGTSSVICVVMTVDEVGKKLNYVYI